MSDSKDIILNAIRVLRTRRVRPSDAKIAWYARREFLQSEEKTFQTLQELVGSGDILRVIYKGGTSYRVAPHKISASGKLTKIAPKKVKFTPTPTDILRPLLSAIAACGGDATKERITEELISSDHANLVGRLDTLLQKELRVGLIGRKLSPSVPGGKNVPLYYITRSAPLALITNQVDTMKSFSLKTLGKTPQPQTQEQETKPPPPPPRESTSPVNSNKKTPAPFEHLHQHLKRLQLEKESLKGPDSGESTPETKCDGGGGGDVNPETRENSPRGYESECQVDDRPISRRGRPRKPPAIYEDLTIFTTKRGRPPKIGVSSRSNKSLKRVRKVFDPSDGSAKRKCPVPNEVGGTTPVSRCDVCSHPASSQNGFEEPLVCHSCSARAHPTCLGYSSELAGKSRLGPWTCMDCKHCAICNMDHNIGTLIFCDECDRAYHLTCHQPPLGEQPTGSWVCFACAPNSSVHSVYDCLSGLPTPRDSPVPDEESRGSAGSWEHTTFDPAIPNAASWTVNNVIEYFKSKGFGEHSSVFRDQDIDGTALLMLTRSDVLTGLDLKLGPALKVYKQIRILQTRLPNPPLP